MATRFKAKNAVPLNANIGEWDAMSTKASTTWADSSNNTPASEVPNCAAAHTAAFNSKISSSVPVTPVVTNWIKIKKK